ncbi:hypothetical protein ACFSKI_13535 [Pseudogracilibacillus auburnensis]|uniref:hypothetical protein n=1 Tax=Pseudogracilibacillus auburnensis TaxID=1494959 RepID=UPI0011B37E47|nr:hypothetical protein [Pseudogracilibacillus auburnensis]
MILKSILINFHPTVLYSVGLSFFFKKSLNLLYLKGESITHPRNKEMREKAYRTEQNDERGLLSIRKKQYLCITLRDIVELILEVIEMNNIIKMLSVNQDFRMVIADTHKILEKELNNFTGAKCIRKFLEQIITNCTLLSAINDFNTKISFYFQLSQGISIFCQINDSNFRMEYKDKLN